MARSKHAGEAHISSFDTDVDLIGQKQGYGRGEYQLFGAADAWEFGTDFDYILKYFAKLRGTETYSRKAHISPIALKDYLPWISLLEPVWSEDGYIEDAVVTLHGSKVAAAYTDNTKKRVSEVHKAIVAARVLASMQKAADIKGGVIGVSEERDGPPPHVRLHILYLPIALDGENISHFFSYVRLDPLD